MAKCVFCDKETEDNYIGGVWLCSLDYYKFKDVFEHYIIFVDEEKLQQYLIIKRSNN